MSEIYRLKNEETGEEQLLVSKEYVDLRIRALRDALITHFRNSGDSSTNQSSNAEKQLSVLENTEIVDLNIEMEVKELEAEKVKTDAKHKFVTQAQLDTFRNKPTAHEVENMINNNANELKNTFNEMYTNLLNMPDAVKQFKELSRLIKDGGTTVTGIMDALATKVDDFRFDMHEDSNLHVSDNDRKALNLLISMINDGVFAMMAEFVKKDSVDNAECANTLDGWRLEELLERRGKYNHIYGVEGSLKEHTIHPFSIDTYLPKEAAKMHKAFTEELLSKEDGAYLFKQGQYNIPEFIMKRNEEASSITLEGLGTGTVFKIDKGWIGNVWFNNLCITDAELYVDSLTRFNNVVFKNCIINMKGCYRILFNGCTFENCEFVFGQSIMQTRIQDCDFFYCDIPVYLGGGIAFINNVKW